MARAIASGVISWKTIRLVGTVGLSSSSRCQAMASPIAARLGRDLGRAVGHVADVADAGLDHVTRTEVPGDRPCLRRRLDDDQLGAMTVPRGGAGLLGPAAFSLRGGAGRLRLRRWCPCWHAFPVLAFAL